MYKKVYIKSDLTISQTSNEIMKQAQLAGGCGWRELNGAWSVHGRACCESADKTGYLRPFCLGNGNNPLEIGVNKDGGGRGDANEAG
jgi:hypothetical protein